jgi:hypothetical protein
MVLHVDENLISVKVFVPSCVAIPTRLKTDYVPIMNWLQLDSIQKSVQMRSTQELLSIKRV